jgi:hypothetical protein
MGRCARMCTGYIGLRILNGQVCKDVKWIHVAQNNAHPSVVVNTFPKKKKIRDLTRSETVSHLKNLLHTVG